LQTLKKKTICGLKQASRSWFTKFSNTLLCHDYKKYNNDYSLFTKGSSLDFVVVLVYVDDIIIVGPNNDDISCTKILLRKH